jgi:RluA family pseudouridine synthase
VSSSAIKLSFPDTREFWEISVLFEDDSLIALAKPARLFTSPEVGQSHLPSLLKLMHEGIAAKKSWAQQRGLSYLMNLNRLDFEVTGIMLFAKSKSAFLKLANQFGSENCGRKYIAVCRGEPKADQFVIDARLTTSSTGSPPVRVDAQRGKMARTSVTVLERFNRWNLVRCEPSHDRLDQVQAHLRHARLPIVGASAYGGQPLFLSSLKPNYRLKPMRTERPLLNRTALHAEEIAFAHPATNEMLVLHAPWPKDFTVALKYLRKFGEGIP